MKMVVKPGVCGQVGPCMHHLMGSPQAAMLAGGSLACVLLGSNRLSNSYLQFPWSSDL